MDAIYLIHVTLDNVHASRPTRKRVTLYVTAIERVAGLLRGEGSVVHSADLLKI